MQKRLRGKSPSLKIDIPDPLQDGGIDMAEDSPKESRIQQLVEYCDVAMSLEEEGT